MKLSIPNPCSENWNKMAPSANGRFCGSCDKVVVDFTKMSEEEIKKHFLFFSNQKTCGHFYTDQLSNDPLSKQARLVLSWYQKSKARIKYKLPRLAALFVLGTTLTLMGCSTDDETAGKVAVSGDSIALTPVEMDSIVKAYSADSLQLNDSVKK